MRIINAFLLLFLIGSASSLEAQSSFKITESTMTIQGTSSLYDWESQVTEVNGTGKIEAKNKKITGIPDLRVEIPVTSIKSAKGKVMDDKAYGALKSEEFPTIIYQLSALKSIQKKGDGFLLKATGQLTMAGTTRTIEMDVTAIPSGSGGWEVQGAKALNMTEYNIEPPKALMGTLKTGEEVTITFSVKLNTGGS